MYSAKVNELHAAIYCRISHDPHAGTGNDSEAVGVGRQEKDCRALAERLGLTVIEVFTDNDLGASSASRTKIRPAYERMLAGVRAGKFKTVISYSNSRLTRRPAEWLDLITLANDKSVNLQIKTCVSGTYDLSTADGRAVALTIAVWDGAEAERTSERLKASHRHRAAQGGVWKGGNRPFGYQDDRKTINPVEGPLLVDAIKQVINGTPVLAIAKQWNRQGVRTPANGEWNSTGTYLVLTNPRNCGWTTYKKELVRDADGEPVLGQWETLITPEIHQALLGVLAKRKKTKRRFGKYLLSGHMNCGVCSQKMWGGANKKGSYYKCSNGCVQIKAELADRWMKDALFLHVAECRGAQAAPVSLIEEWQGEDRLAEVAKLADELMAAFRKGQLSGDVVFSQVSILDAEKAKLIEERDSFYRDQAAARGPRLVEEVFQNVDFESGEYAWLEENRELIESDFTWEEWRGHLDHHCRGISVSRSLGPHTVVGDRLSFAWDDGTSFTPQVDNWGRKEPAKLRSVKTLLRENPSISGAQVAEKLGVSRTYGYKLLNLASQALDDEKHFEIETPEQPSVYVWKLGDKAPSADSSHQMDS